MSFLVLFNPAGTNWRVDRLGLIREVAIEWPGASVDTESRSEASAMAWEFEDKDGPVEASLNSDGTCLHIDGQISSATRAAVWFRRLIPSNVDLIFCDSAYNSNSHVLLGMDASELESRMQ